MKKSVAQFIGIITLLLFSLPAFAASVELLPTSGTVQEGGIISIELFMDVADVVDPDPDAIRGDVIIEFDAALATYNGDFAINSPVVLTDGPAYSAGILTFDFANAPATGVIGTFSLTAIGDVGDIIAITVDDNALLGSSFIDTLPTNKPFNPEFVGTAVTITPIPVPAAAWLLGSALGLLGLGVRPRQA